jgi:hypothetical protein
MQLVRECSVPEWSFLFADGTDLRIESAGRLDHGNRWKRDQVGRLPAVD